MNHQGILLIDKPKDKTSFYLVAVLRKMTNVRKIGHTGTLDPLATGVMVMLIGQNYTRRAQEFIKHDKEYLATILLGKTSDTYDIQGNIKDVSDRVPSLEEIQTQLASFQGTVLQTPPMYSAKKVEGKKLYELARKGIEIERKQATVTLKTELISYDYPRLKLHITCSSGTYVRSIAEDLGKQLGTGALLLELVRQRSGPFHIDDCVTLDQIQGKSFPEHFPLKMIPSL